MTARAGHASSPLRQLTTLAALLEHITASSLLDGAILLGSGVRLASPYRVVTGDPGLAERFTARPPIQRAELGIDVHPVERAYDQLKEVIRRHRQRLLQASHQ